MQQSLHHKWQLTRKSIMTLYRGGIDIDKDLSLLDLMTDYS